jgi:hypothetical protein
VSLAELLYPVLSMSASASDPETSVSQITIYLELRYDCTSSSGGVLFPVSKAGAYASASGGTINSSYNVWSDCDSSIGYADNISGRVRASATDSQGAIGWSSWVTIFISPF